MKKKQKKWIENFVVKLRLAMEIHHAGELLQGFAISAFAALMAGSLLNAIPGVFGMAICGYLLWSIANELFTEVARRGDTKPPRLPPRMPRSGGRISPDQRRRPSKHSRGASVRSVEWRKTTSSQEGSTFRKYSTTVIILHVG